MSELVNLVNEWDRFEKTHPRSSIEDFCRHYLIKKREQEKINDDYSQVHNPPNPNSALAKTVGRIAGMLNVYLKIAYRDEKDIELEEAFFLNAIYTWGEIRKTDAINYNFTEQSTGIDILNRLKKAGLISERDDPSDKRAKLVKVTARGEEKVWGFWERAMKAAFTMFAEVNEDDKRLIAQLLEPVENRHSRQLADIRNKSIDEIVVMTLGKPEGEAVLEEIKKRFSQLKKRRTKK